jgi:hypothetical protein
MDSSDDVVRASEVPTHSQFTEEALAPLPCNHWFGAWTRRVSQRLHGSRISNLQIPPARPEELAPKKLDLGSSLTSVYGKAQPAWGLHYRAHTPP